MNSYTGNVGKKLNNLLGRTRDAERDFKKASELVGGSNLKSYFTRKSGQRITFCHHLEGEITFYGQEIDDCGSQTGAKDRGWIDGKAWFSADNDEAILDEAITGEKAALDAYRDILSESNLPRSTSFVLTQQMNKIILDLADITRIKDV